MSSDFNDHEFDWIPLHFPLSLYSQVCLSPLYPESTVTREPYDHVFGANPNNLAADAEIFLSEWIHSVHNQVHNNSKDEMNNIQVWHRVLSNQRKNYL